jgi:molecular chaperone DnaK
MHVSAKDKTTGKENKITIKSNSGLTEAEIAQMVRDAEENAESDKKARALIEARNQAEGAVHNVRSELKEVETQLTGDQVDAVNAACSAVEEAVKETDVEAINAQVGELMTASQPIFEAKSKATATDSKPDDTVVDADFTEKN